MSRSTRPPAPPVAPASAGRPVRLWILAGFAMTGGGLSRHAALCAGAAEGAGLRVLPLSFHPGGFAEADATSAAAQMAGRPAGIVHLRALARRGGGNPIRAARDWWRRLRSVATLIEKSGPVALVSGSRGPGQWALGLLLWGLLSRPARARLQRATSQTPPVALAAALTGRRLAPAAPARAETALFAAIRAANPRAELRLGQLQLERALALPAGAALPETLRADLRALAAEGRALPPASVEAALCHAARPADGPTPRAVSAALAPSGRLPGLPRIAEHLRQIGKPPRQWRRHVPARTSPPPSGGGIPGALLRHLAATPDPGDEALLAPLATPLGPAAPGLTRGAWLLTCALRLPLLSPDDLDTPWSAPGLLRQFAEACPVLPGVPRQPAAAGRPEIRLTGFAANGTGLARNFWMSAHALSRVGITARLMPVDVPPGRLAGPVPARAGRAAPVLTGDVALHMLNADRIPQEILARHRDSTALHVGFLLWELDRVPPAHRLALEMLDEVWVPSVFLKRLYQGHFRRPIVLMRKGIDLPTPAPWPTPPPGVRRFVTCFDRRSSVARKNPLAAVRAFQSAFGRRRDVELIVKTTAAGGRPLPWSDPDRQMESIAAAMAGDPRIRLLASDLPLPRLLGLIASSDGLVSPHRAEGFGYFPAFALALGVPVAATDHSGTRDFCTPETAEPVAHRLVPVPRDHAILPCPGARWAEVEIDALAAAMTRIADRPDEARARAARGQLAIETDYSLDAQAARYARRLGELGLLASVVATGAAVRRSA